MSTKDYLKQTNLATSSSSSSRRGPRNLDFETTLTIDKTDTMMTVAGKNAVRYTLTGTMKATPPSGGHGGFQGGGRRHGGWSGGGFFGDPGWGGGSGQSSSGGRGRRMPSVAVEGELYLVDSSFLPDGGKNSLLPLLRQAVDVGPILGELNKQLTKMKMAPLSARLTLTVDNPNSDNNSEAPVVTRMEIDTISDQSLDAALFKVPDGYKEVKPDKTTQAN